MYQWLLFSIKNINFSFLLFSSPTMLSFYQKQGLSKCWMNPLGILSLNLRGFEVDSIRVLQNQEASSLLWSLSWYFYSVYSFEYRNYTCANFWGFKWNLNRADILVLSVGQDIFHTENTVKNIFIFIEEAL